MEPKSAAKSAAKSAVWRAVVTVYTDGTAQVNTETTVPLTQWGVARTLCRGAAAFFSQNDVVIEPKTKEAASAKSQAPPDEPSS